MGPDSFLQIGPRLPVSPRHADPVLVHPGPKLRYRFPAILLATPGLFAGYAVNNPGSSAVHRSVDGGHSVGHGGLHHLALLDKVTGRTIATFLHPVTLSLGPGVRVRGRGHLGSDELLPEARGPPVGNHRRLLEDLLKPGITLHHGAVTLGDDA